MVESENPEDGIERIAKSILDRTPWGQLTPEQAYAAALDTPEGKEFYTRYRDEHAQLRVDD